MSSAALFLRFIFLDLVLDIVRFPAWWFSRGAVKAVQWYGRTLEDALDRLALKVLAQNLGRPMFGDYTREGRIISFFMRIIQLVISTILFAGWWVILTVVLIVYLLLPIGVVGLLVVTFPRGA
ncbi:MAG: hypothetical protein HY566_00440 [Candidatus Kerfeldbacteria bacterium]|nr:hypothetical protein [Candidatus Kerfeldbacteria bacterium]